MASKFPLKKGDAFYDVSSKFGGITKYEYLMPFPFHNKDNIGSYHIVINKNTEEPVRIYKDYLLSILGKNLKTYEEAKAAHIALLEVYLNSLKSRLNHE